MFSERVPRSLSPNRIARAVAKARSGSGPLVDLTATNPTGVGFDYPPDLLAPLSSPQGLTYRPDPFGLRAAREAVAGDYTRRGEAVDARRIVLTASTSEAYTLLFKLLCAPHGDASPQNLLCPLDDPDTMVTIDLSFRAGHALGFDLGQLLVGLVHAGLMPASAMPDIARTILTAYLQGLSEEGLAVPEDEVSRAFAISVLLRSGFDGFRYDLLEASDPADREAFDERVAMSRFLVRQFHDLVG